MKNIIIHDEYHQSDFKPSDMLKQYLQMLSADIFHFFVDGRKLAEVPCPACGSADGVSVFERYRLTYRQCSACDTLYVSPRPSDEQINHFYMDAPACRFWREQFSEASRGKRAEKIINPRLEWMLDSVAEYFPKAQHWVDINAIQWRYAQAMAETSVFAHKTLVNPYCQLKNTKGMDVLAEPWWKVKLTQPADFVTLFDIIDHAARPSDLLASVGGMLKSGGLCFMTCVLSSGFDIKELGPHTQNLYPPDHLNAFSVKGIKSLINQHGFECLEFSTPGILDVEIVAKTLKDDGGIPVSAFVKDLVRNQPEEVRRSFQEFLQANLLSSYGRILMRKA